MSCKLLSRVDIPEQNSEIHDVQFLCNLLLLLQPLGLVHPTQYNIIKDQDKLHGFLLLLTDLLHLQEKVHTHLKSYTERV